MIKLKDEYYHWFEKRKKIVDVLQKYLDELKGSKYTLVENVLELRENTIELFSRLSQFHQVIGFCADFEYVIDATYSRLARDFSPELILLVTRVVDLPSQITNFKEFILSYQYQILFSQ